MEFSAEEDHYKEEMQVRDGVLVSWARVGFGPELVGDQARSICPSNADDSEEELRVRNGVAVSWERVGCGSGLVDSLSRSVCPSNADSF